VNSDTGFKLTFN